MESKALQRTSLGSCALITALIAGCAPAVTEGNANTLPARVQTVELVPDEVGASSTSDPHRAARVRVIHASPDSANSANVALALDEPTALFKRDVTYLDAQRYLEIGAGDHLVYVHDGREENPNAQLLRVQLPSLAASRFYTLYLYGRPDQEPPFEAEVAEDETEPPTSGHVRVKFFHAMASQVSLDLCSSPTVGAVGTPLFEGVAYATWGQGAGGSREVDVASVDALDLQLRQSTNGRRPCTGALVSEIRFSVSVPAHLTALAVGRDNSRTAPRQLILCAGAPSQTVCARSRPR
jgi:hypothetical protein